MAGNKNSGKFKEGSIVKLDGTIIQPDGSTTRTQLFDYLNVDLSDYGDVSLSPKEAVRFMNHVRRMKTGVSAFIPKLCPGNQRCALGTLCPYEEKFPLGRQCPLEVNYIKVQTKGYIESLGVDPVNTYEMALVNDLVELDLFDYRANVALAADEDGGPTLLLKTAIEKEDGTIMELVNPHPLLKVKEDTHRKRLKLLDAFAVTRQQEYKKAAALGQRNKKDASNQIADITEMVKKLSAAQSPQDLDRMIEDAKKVAEAGIEEADWKTIEE